MGQPSSETPPLKVQGEHTFDEQSLMKGLANSPLVIGVVDFKQLTE
jgi:hypothetical protein